ncbi:MAG: hypothetical protein LBU09_02250 [Endomicrobium sp.]|jgi:ribosomal protein L17|nr:hypothetical protein [Endomicrobium sp.]
MKNDDDELREDIYNFFVKNYIYLREVYDDLERNQRLETYLLSDKQQRQFIIEKHVWRFVENGEIKTTFHYFQEIFKNVDSFITFTWIDTRQHIKDFGHYYFNKDEKNIINLLENCSKQQINEIDFYINNNYGNATIKDKIIDFLKNIALFSPKLELLIHNDNIYRLPKNFLADRHLTGYLNGLYWTSLNSKEKEVLISGYIEELNFQNISFIFSLKKDSPSEETFNKQTKFVKHLLTTDIIISVEMLDEFYNDKNNLNDSILFSLHVLIQKKLGIEPQ